MYVAAQAFLPGWTGWRWNTLVVIPPPMPRSPHGRHLRRTVLHRVFSPKRGYAWAVEPEPAIISQKFWSRHNVDILDLSLEQFVAGLSERLQNLFNDGGRGTGSRS